MSNDFIDIIESFDSMLHSEFRNISIGNEHQISYFQSKVILLISYHKICSQQQIALWTSRDKAQVARTVKDLEARGMLIRTTHRSTGRSKAIKLTSDGEDVCNKIRNHQDKLLSNVFLGIENDDKSNFYRIFSKMRFNIIKYKVK